MGPGPTSLALTGNQVPSQTVPTQRGRAAGRTSPSSVRLVGRMAVEVNHSELLTALTTFSSETVTRERTVEVATLMRCRFRSSLPLCQDNSGWGGLARRPASRSSVFCESRLAPFPCASGGGRGTVGVHIRHVGGPSLACSLPR